MSGDFSYLLWIFGDVLTLNVEWLHKHSHRRLKFQRFAVHLSETQPKLLLPLFHMIPSIPKFPGGTGITPIATIWTWLKWTSLVHCRMKCGSVISWVQGGDNSNWSRNQIFLTRAFARGNYQSQRCDVSVRHILLDSVISWCNFLITLTLVACTCSQLFKGWQNHWVWEVSDQQSALNTCTDSWKGRECGMDEPGTPLDKQREHQCRFQPFFHDFHWSQVMSVQGLGQCDFYKIQSSEPASSGEPALNWWHIVDFKEERVENSTARPMLPLDKGKVGSSSTSQAEGNAPFPSIIIPQIPAHRMFGNHFDFCLVGLEETS